MSRLRRTTAHAPVRAPVRAQALEADGGRVGLTPSPPTAVPADAPARWGLAELTLVGANLLPLAGLLFLGWKPLEVMIIYWLECVIVWLFTLLKVLMVLDPGTGETGSRRAGQIASRLLGGGFMLAQFAMALFVYGWAIVMVFGGMKAVEHFQSPGRAIVAMLTAAAGSPVVWTLVVSHGCELVMEHRRTQGFRTLDFTRLVYSAFRRMIPVHFMLMIAAGPVMLLGAPALAVAALVVIKIIVDLRQLRREQRGDARPLTLF
jgi:hypothetical protein